MTINQIKKIIVLAFTRINKLSENLIVMHFFVGKEVYLSKDALNQTKFYNNFFARFYLGKQWIIAPMADFGMIKNPTTEQNDQWYALGGSLRFAPVPAWGIAARYEYVHDPNQIINELITNTPNGFQMRGTTLTIEHLPAPQVTLRLEGRYSNAKDQIFNYGENLKSREDFFVMLAVAIKLKNSTAVKMKTEAGVKDS